MSARAEDQAQLPTEDAPGRPRLTWDDVAAMDRQAAIREIVAQFLRHRRGGPARQAALIGVVAAAAAAAGIWVHLVWGPLALVSAAALALGWRRRHLTVWVLGQVDAAEPPLGRLKAVVVMLARTRTRGCDKALLARLLQHAPDEMSCSALGRHTRGFCPHTTTSW